MTIDKKALALLLANDIADLCNQHTERWRGLELEQQDVAGMLTNALVNVVANTAISMSPDFVFVAERMCYSVMQSVLHHQELKQAADQKQKAH